MTTQTASITKAQLIQQIDQMASEFQGHTYSLPLSTKTKLQLQIIKMRVSSAANFKAQERSQRQKFIAQYGQSTYNQAMLGAISHPSYKRIERLAREANQEWRNALRP